MSQTTKTKIWLATQTAKDIPHVVLRCDTFFECIVPIMDDSFDDLDTSIEDVGYGDSEAILLRDEMV